MIITTKHEKGEKVQVNCWAILSKEKKILVFLDETIPDYKEQLKQYNRQGFITVCLLGEAFVHNERLTFSKEDISEKLDPYLLPATVEVIIRKLGF